MSGWTAAAPLIVTMTLFCLTVGVTLPTASVTQDIYKAEEHSNVTLTWSFPIKTDVSVDSLYIDIMYGEPMSRIYLYDTRFEAGLPLYQDELYRGRMACDLELAKTGRIECLLTDLRLNDTGTYVFIIVVNEDSHTHSCYLSVTAARHLLVNTTTKPASRGRNGLYVGFALFIVVTAVFGVWRKIYAKVERQPHKKTAQSLKIQQIFTLDHD